MLNVIMVGVGMLVAAVVCVLLIVAVSRLLGLPSGELLRHAMLFVVAITRSSRTVRELGRALRPQRPPPRRKRPRNQGR